jgi:magnesium-protoporphyrin O-methyltransferase
MIHYPQDKADAMITHLANLADERLIISFAPKTLAYSLLKRIGELFPGPSKVGGAGQDRQEGCAADGGCLSTRLCV